MTTAARAVARARVTQVPASSGLLLRCGDHLCPDDGCGHRQEELSVLRRRESAQVGPRANGMPQSFWGVLQSPGNPIVADVWGPMEVGFGHDFSPIPINSSQPAAPPTKLHVTQPEDVYEQEADRVVEQAMRMTDVAPPEPDGEAEIENSLMRKQISQTGTYVASGTLSIPPIIRDALTGGGGQPIDMMTRAFMEIRFGYDFRRVCVHTDMRADELASFFNARAFTLGQDVVFKGGQYVPGTDEGKRLLAHELVHVVQQSQQPQLITSPIIMRAVSPPPSSDQLQKEIAALRERLAHLEEQDPNVSTPEKLEVERMLASKEALVGETDPIRQKILFYRAQIRELRKQLTTAPFSSAKEPISREPISHLIYDYEVALAGALTANIQRLDKEIAEFRKNFALDSSLQSRLSSAEAELRQNESEYRSLSMIVSPVKTAAVAVTYGKMTPEIEEACMGAFYAGLGAVYTPLEASEIRKETIAGSKEYDIAHKVRKKGRTYTVDRIMSVVQAHGKAGPMMTFKYDPKAKGWSPNVEQTLLRVVGSDCPGLYAFGVSLHGGYHSVIFIMDTSQGGDPQIYWMDQYAKGFSRQYAKLPFTDKNNVTGKLEEKMRVVEPRYPDGRVIWSDTKIWQLIPTPSAGVGGL